MRHHNNVKKLGRESGPRKALMRTLAISLIQHGRIQTTETRAKVLRPFVERLITKSKDASVASARHAVSVLGSGAASVMEQLKARGTANKNRAGGYTRVIKMPERKSDGAPQAIIEFVD